MRIASRRKAIAFFLILGICLVALAVALNISWIILNRREAIFFFIGIIFFAAIIGGMIVNTSFLVREIKRNEQHDSFINAVTHELKTPVASIRLYLETLQRREVSEEQRRNFYSLMLLDTDRLLGTVDQVLKAGEVGYKKRSRIRAELNFANLVRDCVELARTRHHLPPNSLKFEEMPNDFGARVEGDSEDLRTAVSNLIDNAIKYSGNRVDVSVQVCAAEDDRVALTVQDHGVGIEEPELKHIFKRFYRVPSRSKFQVKGTGLGLFIVRAIARAHGGEVSAVSDGTGHGATFTMELPRSAT
jgi:signal transduction histidine kinase